MNEPRLIEATTPLNIVLQAQEWNQILAVLSEAPYKAVAHLITQIAQQAQARDVQPAFPNGIDTSVAPH